MTVITLLHDLRRSSATLHDIQSSLPVGCRVQFLVEPLPEREVDTIAMGVVGDVVEAPIDEWGDLLSTEMGCHVATFVDAYCAPRDEALRAHGSLSSREQAWHKAVQRRLLSEAGASKVAATFVDGDGDLPRALREVPLPAVLKPCAADSGRGVVFLDAGPARRSTLPTIGATEYVLEEQFRDLPSLSPAWLAPYVSVDSVSTEAGRQHLAVLDKFPLYQRLSESGDIGPTCLPARQRNDVLRVVDCALDALGVANTLTHTEVRLTIQGPQVQEVNGRLGGDVERTVRLFGGPSLVAVQLALAAGVLRLGDGPAADVVGEGAVAGNVRLPLEESGDRELLPEVRRVAQGFRGISGVELPARPLPKLGFWVRVANRREFARTVADFTAALSERPSVRPILDADWCADFVERLRA